MESRPRRLQKQITIRSNKAVEMLATISARDGRTKVAIIEDSLQALYDAETAAAREAW